jgi:hypothetical protein
MPTSSTVHGIVLVEEKNMNKVAKHKEGEKTNN